MSVNEIHCLATDIEFKTLRFEEDFTFRKDCGWVWLQRLCFWILAKIGAYRRDETVEVVKYVDIQRDEIYDAVLEAIEDAHMFDRKPTMVVFGGEEWRNLMNSPRPVDMIMDYHLRRDDIRGLGYSVRGLPVKVVPWVKGFAVI